MRAWAAPGLYDWCRAVADRDAPGGDEADRARVVEDGRVAQMCVHTCAHLQAFYAAHVAPSPRSAGAYAPLGRLPVRLSLGTAQSVSRGLLRSFGNFLGQIAVAGGVAPLPAEACHYWAGRTSAIARRFLASPLVTNADEERDRLLFAGEVRAAAFEATRHMTEPAVGLLRLDRTQLDLVRGDLLELDRLCGSAASRRRTESALNKSARLWARRVQRTDAAWAHVRRVAGRLRLAEGALLSALALPFDPAFAASGDANAEAADAAARRLRGELAASAASVAATLARTSSRCARYAERLPTDLAAHLASCARVVANGDCTELDGNVVQPPAHIGAFGPDGRARVVVDPHSVQCALATTAPRGGEAWVLSAFANILMSGALSLSAIGVEYAHRVVGYEYAVYEAALLKLFEQSLRPYGERVGLRAPELRVVVEEEPGGSDT